MKRLFDLFLGVCAAVVLALPIVVVAILVRLTSKGPALYWSDRVGRGNGVFRMPKFRSMRVGTPAVATHLLKDPRVYLTPIGSFLRKSSLDELPQLWSILKGDMSFVGPRPERPQFVDQFNQQIRYYGIRHSVKPGLTGWAQLRYPYGASMHDAEEKLKFDLFYVKNQGLTFDLMILLQTVEVVLFGRGAR